MRKVIFCAAVLFFALATAAFAGRAEIDGAISAYEAVVTEAENIAGMPLVSSSEISTLEEKARAVEEKVSAVQNEREFTIKDAARSAELNGRFNKAMTTIIVEKLLKY